MSSNSMTVEELVASLRATGGRMPFEIGAFVALEVCERVMERSLAPSPADVRMSDEGMVELASTAGQATPERCARCVVDVLAALLVAAGQGVPPTLLDLIDNGPADGRWDPERLRDELEASLVPLNRAASRRVLGRLVREAQRAPARGEGDGGGLVEERELDAELDALLSSAGDVSAEGDPFDEAPTAERAALPAAPADTWRESPPRGGSGPEGRRSVSSFPPEEAETRPGRLGPRGSGAPADDPRLGWGSSGSSEPSPAVAPPVVGPDSYRPRVTEGLELGGDIEPSKSRGWLWALVFATLIGGLVAAVAVLRPDVIDRLAGRPPPEEAAAERRAAEREAERQRMMEAHRNKFGDLVVDADPDDAQVLLFVGRGPAVAENLPIGIAHEFVAIADGKRPTRAVVPKSADWSETDDGARYELAMQAGDEAMSFEELRVGDSKLPRDVGSGQGKLGSVRVITNPPGARVYLLIGFGANVRVSDLPTDQAHELLVVNDEHEPERLMVGPSDWKSGPEGPMAKVAVELEAR